MNPTTIPKSGTGSLLEKETLFLRLFESSPDALIVVDEQGLITLVNPKAEEMFGYDRREILGLRVEVLMPEKYRAEHSKHHSGFLEEGKARTMGSDLNLIAMRKDGSEFPVDISLSPLKFTEGSLVVAAIRDISERKRLEYLERKAAEQRTQLVKDQYQRIVETAEEGIGTVDTENKITFVNPKLAAMLGYLPDEMLGKTLFDFMDEEATKIAKASLERRTQGISEQLDFKFRRKDGADLWAIVSTNPIVENGKYVGALAMITDITARKQAEETSNLQRDALNAAANAILITDRNGKIEWVNNSFSKLTGYSAQESIGKTPGELLKSGVQESDFYKKMWEQILSGQIWSGELINKRKDGSFYTEELTITPIKAETGEIEHFIAIKQDITERKIAEEKLIASEQTAKQRLSQTMALRNIDRAISNSLDPKFTLDIVLDQVINELRVDAADILVYDPNVHMLEFLAAKGFRTRAIEHAQVPMGKGLAGRAVLERKRVDVADLRKEKVQFLSHPEIANEGFIDYHVVPLIAKGKVLGVLGTFKRTEFSAGTEWLDYLETLAGQAAIAIDNIALFEGLQSANDQLVLGYDATIEGWSRALDLRDKETEGHTQRVTALTVQLGAKMGIGNEKLVDVRRGALLHDIGKMGVPDAILHKPGKLTDEEWDIMMQHPQFARDLLTPIAYLKDSIDIPYCHHERWDGTGYPRGLKGENIPFSARVFAIVDVYDALTSDRPYRKAWTKQKALDYIRNQSGTHFDPKVVKAFMEMEKPD